MKDHDLLEAVGGINEKYINNAANMQAEPKKKKYLKWIPAVAACVCLIVIAGIAIPKLTDTPNVEKNPDLNKNTAIAENNNNQEEKSDHANENVAEGIFIPQIELPDSSETEAAKMIGIIVYQGQIYTEAESYYGADAQRIESLVGDYLGSAKGNIDEWSTQDEYATEFASTAPGEVYSVNGYDKNFRICIRSEVEDENHNPTLWIEFYDCLNGITLAKGQDLFEDRLHISERTEIVKWQSHYDWDYEGGNYQDANIPNDVWREFWDAVDNGEFINTWNPDNNMSDPTSNNESIYDTQNQAHLILTMSDGTVIRIRLIEGGYVGYDPLAWYFVKIPEDVFNSVYDACGGTH